MPFGGSAPNKTFTRTTGLQTGSTAWALTKAAGRGIEASDADTHDQDVGDALSALLLRDGGNKPTADIDWNAKKITNLATPTASTDAATKGYADGIATATVNFTVRAATTANITISTALNNGDTLDGLTLSTNDRVLVKDQSAPAENGIYVVGVSPARATDMDVWTETLGAIVNVTAGTAGANTSWRSQANTGGTIAVTSLTFSQYGTSITLPVSLGNGGTGQITAALSFAAIKQAATDTATGVVELATDAEAITGSDTSRATTPANVKAVVALIPSVAPCIILEHSLASSTSGGTATSGADRQAPLNTEVRDALTICSLSANQFTINTAGTYFFKWSGAAYIQGGQQHSLYDVTAAAIVKRGGNAFTPVSGAEGEVWSSGSHVQTILGSNTWELRYRVDTTHSTNGLGLPTGWGQELYRWVEIYKVA